MPDPARGLVEEQEEVLDPARMGPRELRRLPGVGRKRALDILEERERRARDPTPCSWSDVWGIGERTEAGIRAWLREHGAVTTELGGTRSEPFVEREEVRGEAGFDSNRDSGFDGAAEGSNLRGG